MRHIVISTPKEFEKEIPHVIGLFREGLEIFHLRKPKFTQQQIARYIEEIPQQYRNRIMLHTNHKLAPKYKLRGIHLSKKHRKKGFKNKWKLKWLLLTNPSLKVSSSFHSLSSMKEDTRNYDYVFISPIFDSISKKGYAGAFNLKTLKSSLENCRHNVFALGGIAAENVQQLKALGFDGFALLGSIWNNDLKPVEAYRQLIEALENKPPVVQNIEIKPVKIQL